MINSSIRTYHVPAILNNKRKPVIIKRRVRKMESIEEIFKALVLGTRDYMKKNGFGEAAIGLSGGIDSALTAVIAAKAIGSENVVGITMPSNYSSRGSIDDSEALAKKFGYTYYFTPNKRSYAGLR